MAERPTGASGVALALGIAGAVLVVSATRNKSVSDTLRALIRGEPLTPVPGMQTFGENAGGQGSATGAAVAASAASYVGKVPYRWASQTPDGWDCSGFVTWVLHHDHGIELPSNVHTTAIVFYAWPGAVTLPRAQCQPGDLVCWPTHIGIAVDANNMANAAHLGTLTRIEPIWKTPAPTIRRPKAYLEPIGGTVGSAVQSILEGGI